MTGMTEFLELFGQTTISDVFSMGLAVCFVVMAIDRLKKHLLEKQKIENDKIAMMNEIVKAVEKIPKIEDSIQKMESLQEITVKRLDKIEDNARKRERASFKDRLLQSYRYYSSNEHNPSHQWTNMERDAFVELYDEYMGTGDDEQIRLEIRPVMDRLEVIEMHETESVAKLMQSRR